MIGAMVVVLLIVILVIAIIASGTRDESEGEDGKGQPTE